MSEIRKLEIKLRRIESALIKISKPTTAKNDALGQGRTLLLDSRVLELRNLNTVVKEAQELIDGLDGSADPRLQDWLDCLECQRRQMLHPELIIPKDEYA